MGAVSVDLKGLYSALDGTFSSKGNISSSVGNINLDVEGVYDKSGRLAGTFDVDTEGFDIGNLLANNSLGEVALTANGKLSLSNGDLNGQIESHIGYFDYKGHRFTNIDLKSEKNKENILAELSVDDALANLELGGNAVLSGASSTYNISGDVAYFYPAVFGILPKYDGYAFGGKLVVDISGNDIDNITGHAGFENLFFTNNEGKGLTLNTFDLSADNYSIVEKTSDGEDVNKNERRIDFATDFLTASIKGEYKFRDLVAGIQDLLSQNVSSFISKPKRGYNANTEAEIRVTLYADEKLPEFLKLPVKPLKDIEFLSNINLNEGYIDCKMEAPYCLQGTNK
ncbi:MAG: hypothetical protein K2H18_00250, partial [Muribaculaceae bacterium]|nr:hypothetical protein [Muribaculaceae bacterium]